MDRLEREDDVDRAYEKSRSMAQNLSLIAGLGHIYLGKIKIGSALFGLFLFSLLLFLLFYQTSAADPHSAVMFFVYAVTTMTFSILWSLILISDTSDEMNLSFEVGLLRNYYVNDVKKCEKILMACTSIWLMIAAFVFISSWDLTFPQWIWVGSSLLSILPMCYFAVRKKEEKEFVRLQF